MNEKHRQEWVRNLEVLTKWKEMQRGDRTDTISYHTSGEQWGNGVWETMTAVERDDKPTGAARYCTALQPQKMKGGRHSCRQGTGMHSLLLYCKVHRYYVVKYKHSSVHTVAAWHCGGATHRSPCQQQRKWNVKRQWLCHIQLWTVRSVRMKLIINILC